MLKSLLFSMIVVSSLAIPDVQANKMAKIEGDALRPSSVLSAVTRPHKREDRLLNLHIKADRHDVMMIFSQPFMEGLLRLVSLESMEFLAPQGISELMKVFPHLGRFFVNNIDWRNGIYVVLDHLSQDDLSQDEYEHFKIKTKAWLESEVKRQMMAHLSNSSSDCIISVTNGYLQKRTLYRLWKGEMIKFPQRYRSYKDLLKRLQIVDPQSNTLGACAFVSYCRGLTVLPKDFSQLTRVVWLDFHDNEIADISTLGRLTWLKILNLDNNKITDISTLGRLSQLKELLIEHNQISVLDHLAGLKMLEYLYLKNNLLLWQKLPGENEEDTQVRISRNRSVVETLRDQGCLVDCVPEA